MAGERGGEIEREPRWHYGKAYNKLYTQVSQLCNMTMIVMAGGAGGGGGGGGRDL